MKGITVARIVQWIVIFVMYVAVMEPLRIKLLGWRWWLWIVLMVVFAVANYWEGMWKERD